MSRLWSNGAAVTLGLLRSLIIYYAIPWRRSRMRRFYSRFMGQGDLAFDIGSHVGNRIRPWLQLGARVVAVEPLPTCRPILECLYGRERRVSLVYEAVSDSGEDTVLFVPQRNPTLASVSRRWLAQAAETREFGAVRWDRQYTVPSTTLDGLIQRHGNPAFIKIDVEGHEDRVIASLSEPVQALSFELLPAAVKTAQRCIDSLENLASYRYNVSTAESMRFLFDHWITADELRDYLRRIPAAMRSGDIYAERQCNSG